MGGAIYREGRVEVCVDGRWGTVCGEGWTNEDAGHVCIRLGYSKESKDLFHIKKKVFYTNTDALIVTTFGQGTGLVHELTCLSSRSDCQCVDTSLSLCDHSKDIGVRCQSYSEVCTPEYKETLSSLPIPSPMECPTTVTIECPTVPTATMEVRTPVQFQCSTHRPTTESIQCPTLTQCSSTLNITLTPNEVEGNMDTLNNSSTTDTLGALLGLLGVTLAVTLAVVLAGWIMTCVYCHHKINK